MRNAAVAAALALTLAGAAVPAVAQDVADGVVAVVGEIPLMLSDVQFEAEVRTVFAAGGHQVNLGPPALDRGVLDDLVTRQLVLQEAGAEVLEVDAQVADRLEAFLDRFERVEDLTRWLGRWKIGTAELTDYFERAIRAELFAEARLMAMTRVSQREVLEAYQADPDRFGGATLEEVSAALRDELWNRRHDEQYRRWIEGIAAKRGVRYTDLGERMFGGGSGS